VVRVNGKFRNKLLFYDNPQCLEVQTTGPSNIFRKKCKVGNIGIQIISKITSAEHRFSDMYSSVVQSEFFS
jgi:hypothetical protein